VCCSVLQGVAVFCIVFCSVLQCHLCTYICLCMYTGKGVLAFMLCVPSALRLHCSALQYFAVCNVISMFVNVYMYASTSIGDHY